MTAAPMSQTPMSVPMTDSQLSSYLGLDNDPNRERIMAAITPEQRAAYDRMAALELEISLWHQGLGPKPAGAILCGEPKRKIDGRSSHP